MTGDGVERSLGEMTPGASVGGARPARQAAHEQPV